MTAEAKPDIAGKTAREHEKLLIIPLIILMMGQFGTTTDNISLAFAAQDIIRSLHAEFADLSLANSIYSLIAASFMITGGLISIVLKLRNTLRIGILLAAAGEVVLALSPNITTFIWGGRVLVGLGAALLIPATLGLVAAIYHGKNRAIAFGLIGTATGIAKIFAIAGGFIIDYFGFRMAFVVLSIYFIILLFLTTLLPDVISSSKRPRFDFIGTIISAAGLFLLVIGMNKISVWGFLTPIHPPFTLFGYSPALFSIILGLILLVILIPIENRIEDKYGVALLPKSFYKNPTVRNGLYGCAMVFGGLGATVIAINPFFMLVANFSAGQTGIALLPGSIAMILFSIGIPRLFPHINRQFTIRIAYVGFIMSFLLIAAGMEQNGVNFLIYIGLAGLGAVMGVLTSQANSVVANAVNPRDAQQSGGIQSTSRNVGEVFVIVLLGVFLTFVHPLYYQQHVEKLSLPEQTRTQISQQKFTFMSNEKFDEQVASLPAGQQQRLKQQYQQDRLTISRTTMLFAALPGLLALFGTRHIPGKKSQSSRNRPDNN